MKKIVPNIFLLVLCGLACSCANRHRSIESDPETGVHAAVVSECFRKPWWRAHRHYVVMEECFVKMEVHYLDENRVPATSTPDNLSAELHGRFQGIGSDTVTDYIQNSREPTKHLKAGMPLGVPYSIAAKDKIDAIVKSPKGVAALAEMYRGFAGLLTFSRVGFNGERTEALVYVECFTGGLDGSGDYYLLRQDNHRWVIVSSSLVWIS